MPITDTPTDQGEPAESMETNAEKESLRKRYSRFRKENNIPIDWKEFRKSQGKFAISATLTMLGLGIGAWGLLRINKMSDGSFSKVACQALLGISSEPLMVVSAILLVGTGLFVTLLLILTPKTDRWSGIRDILKYSFKGIADFSTQLPLAVGAVGAASSSYVTAIPSLFVLVPICLFLAAIQHLVFSIIFCGVDHEQTRNGKWLAFVVALITLGVMIYLSTTLDWSRYLYQPRLCG